jgi:hypothetical protein
MTALLPGSNGARHSADMIRATAPSGGRVFAMGTMELAWALDGLDGRSPSPQVAAFVSAALRDLTRPAPPAALIIRHSATGLIVSALLRAPDPRILRVIVRPVGGGRGCADSLRSVPATAPAPRHPLCRDCDRPVGGVTAADRHRAAQNSQSRHAKLTAIEVIRRAPARLVVRSSAQCWPSTNILVSSILAAWLPSP